MIHEVILMKLPSLGRCISGILAFLFGLAFLSLPIAFLVPQSFNTVNITGIVLFIASVVYSAYKQQIRKFFSLDSFIQIYKSNIVSFIIYILLLAYNYIDLQSIHMPELTAYSILALTLASIFILIPAIIMLLFSMLFVAVGIMVSCVFFDLSLKSFGIKESFND